MHTTSKPKRKPDVFDEAIETRGAKPDRPAAAVVLTSGQHSLLLHVLYELTGADERWDERRKKGRSDAKLLQDIRQELAHEQCVSNPYGAIACRGGQAPAIWWGNHHDRKKRAPDLAGDQLIAAVREAMQVPDQQYSDLADEPPKISLEKAALGAMSVWQMRLLLHALCAAPGAVERWRTFWRDVHQGNPNDSQIELQISSEFRRTAASLRPTEQQNGHRIEWWIEKGTLSCVRFDSELGLCGVPLAAKVRTVLTWIDGMGWEQEGQQNGSAVPVLDRPAPKTKAGKRGASQAAAAAEPEVAAVGFSSTSDPVKDLPIDQVQPDPDQPRKTFDQAKQNELTASIRQHGVLQAILVRWKNGRCLIVAGERRWRSAKAAGLKVIPCREVALDDKTTREVQIIENLQRDDLNEIDKAQAFQDLLEGDGKTPGLKQHELATRLGITQGEVSNTTRLLQLPKAWADRVISGEMTASMGRDLVPWCKRPQVLTKLEKRVQQGKPDSGGEWQDWIRNAVREVSRTMGNSEWPPCRFKPTAEQVEKLQIIEVPDRYRNGEKEQRALNCKLWDKLQKAAQDAERKKQEEKSAAASKPQGKPGKKKPGESPVQRLQRFAGDLEFHRRAWLTTRILDALAWTEDDELTDDATLQRVMMAFMLFWQDEYDIGQAFDEEVGTNSKKSKSRLGASESEERLRALFRVPAEKLPEVVVSVIRRILQVDPKRRTAGDNWDFPQCLLVLGEALGITFSRDWEPDEAFVSLWPEEWLRELATRKGFPWHTSTDQAKKVALDHMASAVLQGWPKGYVPSELLTASGGKVEREKPAAVKKAKTKKPAAKGRK